MKFDCAYVFIFGPFPLLFQIPFLELQYQIAALIVKGRLEMVNYSFSQ
jgi:hypothetical protein